jgi:hypothetical protein
MTKIKILDNLIVNYNEKVDSFENLKKQILTAYKSNKTFFRTDPPLITITFVYDRLQMNTILHRETKNWEVGYAYNHEDQINQIAIFSPEVFETVSTHTMGNFIFVLTHELAHVFTSNVFGFFYPVWLYEGLAGYVAKQYTKVKNVEKFSDFSLIHDKENWNQNTNYPQAYLFTKYLMDKNTEEKMFRFFKLISQTLNRYHIYQDFENTFEKFFKIGFNIVVTEWRKTVVS